MVLLAPSLLLLLPLALVVLRRGGQWDLRGPGAVRAAAVAALVLALARPVVPGDEERSHQVLVVDHRSGAEAASAATARLEGLERTDRVVLVEIGGPLPDQALAGRSAERVPAASLADALLAATAAIPAGARGAVTLVSDGGDESLATLAPLQDLIERGLPLHAVALPAADDAARPVVLDAPEGLRAGATGVVRVVLSGLGEEVRVTLSGDGEEWGSRVLAAVDGRTELRFAVEPPKEGFVEARVRVEESSGGPARERSATLAVQAPTRVLALTARVVGSGERLAELAGPGFQVDERGADDGADGLPEPGDYDLVVVDDRPASLLPAAFQARLVSAVQGGGVGLLASGGEAAFGPGGWHDTPLASVLPVDAVQKEEKRDPSVALVIIIDTSGSMGGNRVQLAKEVSRLALKRLLPHDKAGIVEFYGAKRWAAPLQPASNHIELERALNRMQAGGGTVILPAIEEAWYGLKNVNVRYKHVLVLTDGGVESGAFEPLLRAMADDGITVSTVLIGGDAHSEFLVNLANWGKGRFYGVPNRFNLPEILLKQPASAKLPAWRPVPTALEAGGGPTWWGEVDPSSVPSLAGHVETRLRPGAEEVLSTAGGTRPVLASWRHGLGRVTAFTSELTGPGAGDWADWDERGAFLARVLRRTAKDLGGAFRFTARREGARLVVEAARREEGTVQPRVLLGDEELRLSERAPGWFVAERWLRGDEVERDARLVAGTGPELRDLVLLVGSALRPRAVADPARALDPAAAARWVGGVQLRAEATPTPAGGPERAPGTDDLRPLLALLALALHLTSVYLRRRPLEAPAGAAA